jgi:hypothetical protein
MTATCATCRYYAPERPTYGRCHRYPPTVVQLGEVRSGGSTSPAVDRNGWCGEHAEKDAPTTRELLMRTHRDLRELLTRLSAPLIVTGEGCSKESDEVKP